jgi:phage terminase small subunit
MAKGLVRPELRAATGRAPDGRAGELEGEPLNLVAYDVPVDLGEAGRLQWLNFAEAPLPWWTEADLPTIAQYCVCWDDVHTTSPSNKANLHRELRMLADQLGLSPMSRARMAINKTPAQRKNAGDDEGGKPAEVIEAGSLFSASAE